MQVTRTQKGIVLQGHKIRDHCCFCSEKLTFGKISHCPASYFAMFSQQNPKQTGPRENVLLQHACAFTKDSRYLLSMSFVLHVMAVPIGWPLSSVNTLSYSPERSACSPSLHGYILYPAGLAALISPACRI